MKIEKRQWIIYLITGVLFGIFYFLYQEFIQNEIQSEGWITAASLMWLVPVLLGVIYEVKSSYSIKKSVICAVSIACSAVIAYYLFLAFKIIFIGGEGMDFRYISNYQDNFYFTNLFNFFMGDILSGILQGISVALVFSSIAGFCISYLYIKVKKKI